MKRFLRFLKYLAFILGLLAFSGAVVAAEIWLIANGRGWVVAAACFIFMVWAAWSASKEAA